MYSHLKLLKLKIHYDGTTVSQTLYFNVSYMGIYWYASVKFNNISNIVLYSVLNLVNKCV